MNTNNNMNDTDNNRIHVFNDNINNDILIRKCLSISTLKETFSTEKANYTIEVHKMLTKHKIKKLKIDENYFKPPKRCCSCCSKLDEYLDTIRSYVRGDFKDSLKLFKCFKKIAVNSHKKIKELLVNNDLGEIKIEFSGEINWKDLVEKLHKTAEKFSNKDLENLIDACKINQEKEEDFSKIKGKKVMKVKLL